MPPKKSGHRAAPGSNANNEPTLGEQVSMIDTFAARISPGVANRSLFERYLRLANWNLEAAIARYRSDRARFVAQINAQVQAPVPPAPTAPATSSSAPGPSTSARRRSQRVQTCQQSLIVTLRLPSLRLPPPETSAQPEGSTEETSKTKKTRSKKGKAKEEATNTEPEGPQVNIPFNGNYEQERRNAALALRLFIEEQTGETDVVSPAEAILLLHQHDWDLGEAVASFTSLPSARLGLGRTYDQMRVPVQREIATRQQEIPLRQQSERLAELINITGRPDWYSMRLCLQSHRWNLVAAVNQWFTTGIPPVEAPGDVANRGLRIDENLRPLSMPTRESTVPRSQPESTKRWATEPDNFLDPTADSGDSSTSDESQGPTRSSKPRKRGLGFMINWTPKPLKAGMRNDKGFLLEYVSRGRYWYNRFEKQSKFKWPNVQFPAEPHGHHPNPDQSRLVEFDWNNQNHLNDLNSWRRQGWERVTDLRIREQAQRWSQEELDYLYALSDELLQEQIRKHPNKTEDQLLPLTVSAAKKEEWAKRVNDKFRGTMQPGARGPRRDREAAAIMTQRNRTRALCDRFKLKADESYFARVAAKDKQTQAAAQGKRGTKRPRPEEEDSDEEGVLEPDGDDQDDDSS